MNALLWDPQNIVSAVWGVIIYSYNYDLFLEKNLTVLGRHVEKNPLVSFALCVNATERDIRIVAIQYSINVCTNYVTVFSQRVEQLLQSLQTYM